MRKMLILWSLLLGLGLALQAAPFSKAASGQPELIQNGPQKMWCPVCGMNLKMFYKTSHAVILKDGTKKQYCSIRCLAADWPNISDKIDRILVVDAKTEKLIDAKNAHYVVGSDVKGTMSMTSKIAFGSLEEAEAFRKEHGGKIVDFDTAFKMAADALGGDTAMIAKKKKMKMYPMGEKIYKQMCQPIDIKRYSHINDLKAAIKTEKLCKPMKEKQLQAVALYLWDVVGGHGNDVMKGCGCGMKQGMPMGSGQGCGCQKGKKCSCKGKCNCAMKGDMNQTTPMAQGADLSKQDKCPVCGMFVYKYPKWAAFIYYEKDGKLAHLAFDGVKDMMKFYFNPSKWGDYAGIKKHIKKMVVRDYYTLKPIWAKTAYYVVGSDVVGPMGNELIPFKSKEAAENFMKDHHGKRVLTFDQISEALVYKLDE